MVIDCRDVDINGEKNGDCLQGWYLCIHTNPKDDKLLIAGMANSFEQESENSLKLEAIGTSIGGSIPSPSKSESIDLEYIPYIHHF